MADVVVRALLLLFAALVAVALGRMATKKRRSSHPVADISTVDTDAALVAFTSTECENCEQVMRQLVGLRVKIREITHENEPALFEAAGVDGVPLVVVLRPDGTHASQFAGTVRRRALSRALIEAGW